MTPLPYDDLGMSVMTETVDTSPGPLWTVPSTLSPSRVESFLSCPLAFRAGCTSGAAGCRVVTTADLN